MKWLRLICVGLLCMGGWGLGSFPAVWATDWPIPDIRVNHSNGPTVADTGRHAEVTVSLDPRDRDGMDAEWWIAAATPFAAPWNYASYIYPDVWTAGILPCIEAPLFPLTPPFSVLRMVLPEGRYAFYFVLDSQINGIPDFDWWDVVEVEAAEAPPFLLPDTGCHVCWDDNHIGVIPCPEPGEPYYGQDAQYQRPEPAAYVDNEDGTVTDWNTGLMWQQWSEMERRTWAEACAYCESLELADYEDWRLPEIEEIATLPDYSQHGPAIDEIYFPGCHRWWFWSHTTSVGFPNTAWTLNFDYGDVDQDQGDKETYRYVRCVRGEIFTSGKEFSGLDGGRFIGNGDGTISDPVTGIMWQRDAGSEALLNWKDALAYCESLELGGHSDWRLPDVRSLGSIVDYSRFEPAIGAGFQCWWDTGYWTSTTLKDTPQHAWVVGFWYGDYFWAIKESGQHHVRCARGGPLVSMENAAGPVE